MRILGLCLLLLLARAGDAATQALRIEGRSGHEAAVLLREIAARGSYRLITEDTVLGDSARVEDDLVVLGADVRVEGVVEGAVAVLSGGRFFVRPGARVEGPIVVAGGGAYPSGLAQVGRIIELPASTGVEVAANGTDYRVVLVPPAAGLPLRFDGLFGVGVPTYNRVDGVTARWGGAWSLADDREGARLAGSLLYHSARGAVGGEASLRLPVGGGVWAIAEASRRSATNDAWIRGDLANSLAALFFASDVRNYHEVDEVSLTLERRQPAPLIEGESFWGPWLTLRASDDRSLSASTPWAVFAGEEEWRPNPPIEPGRLVSAVAGMRYGWQGRTAAVRGVLSTEWAPPGLGDFEFFQAVGDARVRTAALWGHTVGVHVHAMGSLGELGAPPQRWSFVGGPNTLPTLPTATYRGDQLVFVESEYAIPLRRPVLPLVGAPTLRLLHAVGAAWLSGLPPPDWEQNAGVGIALRFLEAAIYVNPAQEGLEPTLTAGLQLPF